jgi:SAM-dependent methyltransferase
MPDISTHTFAPPERQSPLGTCQICGSAIPPRYRIPAVRRWGSDSDSHVYWCGDCDAGFLLPRPSRELLESLYSDRYFADYGKPAAIKQSLLDRVRVNLAWRFDRGVEVGPWLFEAIANNRSATICDLGCGNGTLLEKLRTHGFRVLGIEPSPFARREIESKGIKVYEGTAESLPNSIPEAPFDFVVMTHVLEHCLDPQLALSNALELVGTGGHLVIEVPNCGSFQFENRGPAWFHFDVGRHVNYFTPRALGKLVEGQGATIEQYYYYQYLNYFLPLTLALETSLWDRSHAEEDSGNLARIRRPSKLENWMSLPGSFALKAERKYGCMGIVVRKG